MKNQNEITVKMSVTKIKKENVNDDKIETKQKNEDSEEEESVPLNSKCDAKETIKKPVKFHVKEKLTFTKRLKIIKDNTTVEPIMACYVMPMMLVSLVIQNFKLEKACRVNLGYNGTVCDALALRQTENYTFFEDEVQRLTASIQTWKNIVQTAIPVLIILFVGAWSDKTGKRKACILIPIVGEMLSSLGLIVNTYYFYELPVEVTALTKSIFPAITGGQFTNYVGVFSYIGDITTIENRTYRVGLVKIFIFLGYPFGIALSGVLLTWIGYYGVFTISIFLYFFCLIYGYYYLEEPKRKETIYKMKIGKGRGFLREFFDVSLVMETFRVAFKKGVSNRRFRVCLLLIVVCVVSGPRHGELSVLYLFTRYRFNWDEVQFSMWATYAMLANLFGTYLSITLFSKYLKLDDTLLGIISNASKIIAAFAYAFAKTDLEIYLAHLLEIFNGTASIAMRSIASKLVNGEEFGKVNSLFGLAEATMPLVYGPLYSRVYMATLTILPGAVFLLGAILTLPSIVIFGWLYFEHKKDIKRNASGILADEEKLQNREAIGEE